MPETRGDKSTTASAATKDDKGTSSTTVTQYDHFCNIARLKKNFGKDSKDRHNLGYFEARLQRLQELWTACQEHHTLMLDETADNPARRNSYLEDFETSENQYLDLLGAFKGGIRQHQGESSISITEKPASGTTKVQLERLVIPKFDGSYRQWRMFIDLFTSMVHNNESLSAVEKMQYLKTHLTGEATRVIQHMDINSENYEAAVEMLRKRYDNKRSIAWSYLHTFHKLPAVKEERDFNIKQFMDTTAELIANMKSIGVNTEHWDILIIYSVTQRLDHETRRLWETSIGASSEIPTLATFIDFLTSRFRTLEALNGPKKPQKVDALTVRDVTTCDICSKSHHINQCDTFKALNLEQRQEAVKRNKLCFNCLRKGHVISKCPSKSRCRTCSKQHHTLLHDSKKRTSTVLSSDAKPFTPSTNSLFAEENYLCQQVLLATARIKVENASSELVTLRALVDSGSQRTFITESAAQLLGLKREYAKITICGLGATSKVQTKGSVLLNINPRCGDSVFTVSALVIPNITNICPSIDTKVKLPKTLSRADLADPLCGTPSRIDVLLGADVYNSVILPGFKKGTPCAVNTVFGWILLGPTTMASTSNSLAGIVSLVSIEEETDQLVKRFWDLTEAPVNPILKPEETAAAEWYQKTTRRDDFGRYIVRLPFKENVEPAKTLRDSQRNAHIRFSQLERKLANDGKLRQQYIEFMEEYRRLGHMVEVPAQEKHSKYSYYLPHHAVVKAESTTTKLRVVFNASAKTPSGKSLNDTLLTGPSYQNNIIHILMKWRTYKYVVAADIEKMYRQIIIDPRDQDYQRILWRNHPSHPMKHYKLTTVTYGTASAPFLAMRTLHQLADDEKLFHPQACHSIKHDFYVDDVLTGGDTIDQVKCLQQDLITVLHKGGFNLRKWTGNDDTLLNAVPVSDRETNVPLNIHEDAHIKTLGLRWHPARDSFSFKVNLEPMTDDPPTKRQLLSEIAKFFDPVGWLQPCIIFGKIIMQQLWLEGTEWDEPVPNQLSEKWRNFRAQLSAIEEISIPRWLNYTSIESIQVHGFCDASESAYAATIYLRVQENGGKPLVNLITAKSKVASLKVRSIPRLELCGAALLCELMNSTLKAHGWDCLRPYYWTDSTIVLQWLRQPATKWKVFVANRVGEIQSSSEPKQWRHVGSKSNPADIASRGALPQALVNDKLWWNGPDWLSEDPSKWPKGNSFTNSAMIDIERRTNDACLTSVSAQTITPEQTPDIFQRFSSFTKLVRVTAYCRRWKTKNSSTFLTSDELKEAEIICVRIAQREAFSDEIEQLENHKPLRKSSRLIRQRPFLDSEGLLRVGGRTQQSELSYDTKHQIILPRGHLANLIIKHYHHLTLHGGQQLVHATIRTKFWIIDGATAVKALTRKCVTCFKVNAKPSQQLMGQLPYERVQPGKPFARTGIDYAGPITIKWSSGRGSKTTKAYIAVFVCLSTKAVHLELVSDLTAKACIAAIRRFIARRGMCHTLISDNGTNFVGANKLLKAAAKEMIKEAQQTLIINSIDWKFIPPGSPHFGGIWEAAVKSMKRHLTKVIGSHLLNVEEMYTLLAQIEACLNSRPLTPISTDSNDLNALTPGHFLTGENLFELPDENTQDNPTKKWQLVQKLKQQFWQRWSLEYLTQLQQRAKWFTETRNIKVNDLVLVKLENCAATQWPLGRILALHPGEDGLTRVVTIKTSDRTMKRPISKICPLPIDEGHKEPKTSENSTTDPHCTTRERKTGISKKSSTLSKLMVCLLAVLVCVTRTKANFTIKHPESGLYIEHIGQVHLMKGQIRMDIHISPEEIKQDLSNLQQVRQNTSYICEQGVRLHQDTRCKELVERLNQGVNSTFESITSWIQNRSRRGILGNILQGIFGVNDEVYTDIDKLDENQKRLIDTMQHQGHLLLTTTARVNDTQHALTTKLNAIIEKFNHVSKTLTKMSSWYISIDQNRISLDFLTTYQLAFEWLEQIQNRYNGLYKIQSGIGSLAEICSPTTMHKTLALVQSKLGKGLFIEPREIQRTQITKTQNGILISGFFPIIEQRNFELLHCTGIPHSLNDGNYSVPDVSTNYFGVNYDDQLYFELSPKQFDQCETVSNNRRHCSVSILQSISEHPNCILDEIFERTNKISCPLNRLHVKDLLWKQLTRANNWLFLSSKKQSIAITCSGHRQDVKIQGVGIIEMGSHCSIQSSTAIIRANSQITETVHVQSTYIKPIRLMQDTVKNTNLSYLYIATEPLLKQDDRFIHETQQQEALLRSEFSATIWHQTRHHNIVLGTSVGLTLLVASIIISVLIWRLRRPPVTDNANPKTRWYER